MAYYVLLCVRLWAANKERPHYPTVFSTISHENNKSELEDNELEMKGFFHFVKSTIGPDSQSMSRQIVKQAISSAFIQLCEHIKGQEWKLYKSDNELFILSDALYANFSNEIHILPVSPKEVFIAQSTYEYLERESLLSVKSINSIMLKNAINYYITYPT